MSVGVDVGGTFTDLAALSADGRVETRKVTSTPSDQSEGVERALAALGGDASRVERIVHGTTVVTNLLLERRGARVVLCATAGATDLLELRRQNRAALYDLAVHHPPPLVPFDRVVAVDERITPSGVERPLTGSAARQAADRVAALEPDVVAVALLHSYADPAHEQRLAESLRRVLPSTDVVLSSDVLPEIREYERTATTSVEAYARPGVSRYLGRLGERLTSGGWPAPGVMTSGGGMRSALDAARSAAALALSGPAGGVVGAAHVAREHNISHALTIDVGGTSADVGLVLDGEPLVEPGGLVAGVPIALPRVLVETVSAGGGSVGWIDDGGALRVGPRSAGAVPGPASFGRGGTEATVTDAHVVLGNVRAGRFGALTIDRQAADRAVGALAARLGATAERTARAMVAAADAEMARALRRVSVERGIDPRSCVIVAFGGGGPLHACGLADMVGASRVLVPPHAGVLSAVGLALAGERRESLASVVRDADALDAAAIRGLAESLARAAGAGERRTWTARVRYAGQGHELDVAFTPDDDGSSIARRFREQHQRRYGFTLARAVEVVGARHSASAPPHRIDLRRQAGGVWNAAQRVDDGSRFAATVDGHASIVLPDATLLVAAGWTARALESGGWMVERAG